MMTLKYENAELDKNAALTPDVADRASTKTSHSPEVGENDRTNEQKFFSRAPVKSIESQAGKYQRKPKC